MSLLHKGTIHSTATTDVIEYDVFGNGSDKVIWLFREPLSNYGKSVTNSIEDLFKFCLPEISRQTKDGFLNLGQAECESALSKETLHK